VLTGTLVPASLLVKEGPSALYRDGTTVPLYVSTKIHKLNENEALLHAAAPSLSVSLG